MENLKARLIEKRNENPPPNNNPFQTWCATKMLEVIDQYEKEKISKTEFRRQMRLLRFQANHGLVNGKTQPLIYTGMGALLDEAVAYFD